MLPAKNFQGLILWGVSFLCKRHPFKNGNLARAKDIQHQIISRDACPPACRACPSGQPDCLAAYLYACTPTHASVDRPRRSDQHPVWFLRPISELRVWNSEGLALRQPLSERASGSARRAEATAGAGEPSPGQLQLVVDRARVLLLDEAGNGFRCARPLSYLDACYCIQYVVL